MNWKFEVVLVTAGILIFVWSCIGMALAVGSEEGTCSVVQSKIIRTNPGFQMGCWMTHEQ